MKKELKRVWSEPQAVELSVSQTNAAGHNNRHHCPSNGSGNSFGVGKHSHGSGSGFGVGTH